jgi:hypothetical protein
VHRWVKLEAQVAWRRHQGGSWPPWWIRQLLPMLKPMGIHLFMSVQNSEEDETHNSYQDIEKSCVCMCLSQICVVLGCVEFSFAYELCHEFELCYLG